jgi:hypothetical protein
MQADKSIFYRQLAVYERKGVRKADEEGRKSKSESEQKEIEKLVK